VVVEDLDQLVFNTLFTSFDDNYFRAAAVSLKSIAKNYNGTTALDYYCFVPLDLMSREQEFINLINEPAKLNIKFVNAAGFNELITHVSIDPAKWYSTSAMHRLFASSLLSSDTAIYIDPDTIATRDIAPLLSLPLMGKMMAFPEMDRSIQAIFPGQEGRAYFNDGVFITDLTYWRENDLENKMVDYVKNNPTPEYPDQDLLNIFFTDVLYPLHPIFNGLYYLTEYTNFAPPIILHFIGPVKPWNSPNVNTYFDMWHEIDKTLTA